MGRGHRWIDLYQCVIFRLSASREVALPGFLMIGALGADRCVQTVFAVDSAHRRVCAPAPCSAVRGWARVEAGCMLLSADATGGCFVRAQGGWMAELAAIAAL